MHSMDAPPEELRAELMEEKTAELERWIDLYGDRLLRMCYLYLRDLQLAEDAVQETFLRAYRTSKGFRGDSAVSTWLSRIAINVCKNFGRKSWNQNVELLETAEKSGEDAVEKFQDSKEICRAVANLPGKYREAVLLFYYQGLKIREIAKILKVPEGTVSVRLSRARKQLERELKGWFL